MPLVMRQVQLALHRTSISAVILGKWSKKVRVRSVREETGQWMTEGEVLPPAEFSWALSNDWNEVVCTRVEILPVFMF